MARGGDVVIRAGDGGGDVTIRAGDARDGRDGGSINIRAGDGSAPPANPLRAVPDRDELRTLAADFADLAKRDATLTARLSEVGKARQVRVLSNDCNAAALRTFRRLASEAARTLGVASPSSPDGSPDDWLAYLFVAGEGLGYVEIEHSDMAELQKEGATETMPFVSRAIRNAAEASALVLRRVTAHCDAEQSKAQPAPPEVGDDGVPKPPAASADAIDPAILARLEAAVAAIPAVLEGSRASLNPGAGVIESLGARHADEAPAVKLPKLKAHDRQAWQLATLHGMTQANVAAALNEEHKTTYTQGQVSRMIARAKKHAEASGLAEKVAGPIDRPSTVDPGRLELGARVDKRNPRPSDMARVNDDDD